MLDLYGVLCAYETVTRVEWLVVDVSSKIIVLVMCVLWSSVKWLVVLCNVM